MPDQQFLVNNPAGMWLRTAPIVSEETKKVLLPNGQVVTKLADTDKPDWWRISTNFQGADLEGFSNKNLMLMTEITRYKTHGSWVGLYAFVSFVSLFAIALGSGNWIYSKLLRYCGSQQELQCDPGSNRIGATGVDLAFVHTSACRFIVYILCAIVVGLLIAFLVRLWWSSDWKFLIPMLLYVSVPFVVSPDPIGVRLVAFFYAALIYIMRFSMKFNPHRTDINQASRKDVLLNIFRMYHQYAILSLAVIGLTLSTFIFGFEAAFREFWDPLWSHFPSIRWPFYVSHALFLGVGITGLALGVCREFHKKQEELLTRGFD